MKARVWLALTLMVASLAFIAVGSKAHAWTEFRSGKSATVTSGETLDSSLWVGARDINIDGIVNGDVICGGQSINISGTVKGDVICGGQTITISGKVEGNVRLGAQTVNLNGSIDRNATIAAQTINVDSRATIGGDASFAATDTNLNGTIGRDLSIGGNNLNLSGTVNRDIKSSANQITLVKGTKVGGGIEYTSKSSAKIDSGATVSGKVTQHQPKHEGRPFLKLMLFAGLIAVIFAVMLIISALIVTALLPQFVHSVSSQAVRRPWIALLTGFVASIVVPIIGVLLMVTIVGIPLGILVFLLWLLVALTSGLFSAYFIGWKILRGQTNALLRVLAGSLILVVLYFIPIAGFIFMILALWLGAGMLLLEINARRPKLKYNLK